MSRYIRQTMLADVGDAGQKRLAKAKVLVVGCGGLAATVLPLLAGAGVGQITMLDPDLIEDHNLHRQTFFTMSDLGQPKAQVMALRLAALNPEVRITPCLTRLGPDNVGQLLGSVDLVVDAADSFMATYVLSDHCLLHGIPLVSASVQGMAGYAGGFCGSAPSYRAVFPKAPGAEASCATVGVLAPAVAMLAACQAQMVLAHVLGLPVSPLGRLLRLDLADFRSNLIRFDTAAEPEGFVPFVAPAHITTADLVYDLRDAVEAPCIASYAQRLGACERPIAPPEGRLILGCRSGLRAWRLAEVLAAQGVQRLALVAFGA